MGMRLETNDFSCILNCLQKARNNPKVKSMLAKHDRKLDLCWEATANSPVGCHGEEGLSRVEQVRNTLVKSALASRRA